MMKITDNKFFRHLAFIAVVLASMFASNLASAEEANEIYETQIHIASDGLAVQQPTISQKEIFNTLTQAHKLLTKKIHSARKIVDENSTSSNMVIAAIMPGGLIYLAYKQGKLSDAKEVLTKVKTDLKNLDKDAISLYQPSYTPSNQAILVARYP